MAVIGRGGVNDIYTDSTGIIGTSSIVAGESLKLNADAKLLPVKHSLGGGERDVENIRQGSTETTYYNTAATSQFGNPVLPDGRSLYIQTYSGGNAYCVVLDKDGTTRAGTTYTLLSQTGNTASNQFTFWQVGETASYYQMGLAYRSYHSNTYYYQKLFLITVAKASNAITNYAMATADYMNYVYPGSYPYNWHRLLISNRDVNNWHTCRDNAISLFAAPKNNYVQIYRFTATAFQSNGNFHSAGGTDYEELAHYASSTSAPYSLNIVKIDDANGIFLVMHETVSGTQTLTKLVVSSSAQITSSTVATIDSSYSGLNSAFSRVDTAMVGSGTGSNNLCFIRHYDTTTLQVQPCTYNSSTDALTWGTYVSLDTPSAGGIQATWYTTILPNYREKWTYSPATKKVYFSHMAVDKTEGLVLDTQNSTLKIANLHGELSNSTASDINITASKDGTSLVQMQTNPSLMAHFQPWGVDTGELVTTNASAIALEAGVLGETIDISLLNGITSNSTDLPSTYYLKKNDLFFPYTVYIDGTVAATAGAASVIKSIQRGKNSISNNSSATITIEEVDLDKTLFVIGGSSAYGNTQGTALYLDDVTATSFKLKGTGYYTGSGTGSWEVIEYV
jgi:hypothetical protein